MPERWLTELEVSGTGPRAWSLDWDVPAAPVNDLHVIVDTSDSCWPAQRGAIRDRLGKIARSLGRGDRCELWLLDRAEPVARIVLTGEDDAAWRAASESLASHLRPVEGGTWLRWTADAVERAIAATDVSAHIPWVVLLTDGEVFDAEAIPAAPDGRHVVVPLANTEKHHEHRLPWNTLAGDHEGWRELFRRPEVVLDVGDWKGRVFEIAGSDLEEVDPARFHDDHLRTRVRRVFVGTNVPAPALVARIGEREIRRHLSTGTNSSSTEHALLGSLIRGKLLLWNRRIVNAVVGQLERRAAEGIAPCLCPNCGTRFALAELLEDAFCSTCGSLRLADGTVRRDALRSHTNNQSSHIAIRLEPGGMPVAGVERWTGDNSPDSVRLMEVSANERFLVVPIEPRCFR